MTCTDKSSAEGGRGVVLLLVTEGGGLGDRRLWDRLQCIAKYAQGTCGMERLQMASLRGPRR